MGQFQEGGNDQGSAVVDGVSALTEVRDLLGIPPPLEGRTRHKPIKSDDGDGMDRCDGEGDPTTDWLLAPCATAATLSQPTPTSWVLRNGIVSRTLAVDPATKVLATTKLISEVTEVDKLAAGSQPAAPLAEAELSINDANVLVGGPNASALAAQHRGSAVQLTFAAFRHSSETIAGNFSWTTGSRHTRKNRVWPPKGLHVEFDHTGSCSAVDAGASGTTITVTVDYELYQGVSAFTKRLLLSHTCSDNLFVFNMSVHLARHRNTKTGIVELIADGQPGLFLKGTALSSDSNINAAAYEPIAQSLALDRRYLRTRTLRLPCRRDVCFIHGDGADPRRKRSKSVYLLIHAVETIAAKHKSMSKERALLSNVHKHSNRDRKGQGVAHCFSLVDQDLIKHMVAPEQVAARTTEVARLQALGLEKKPKRHKGRVRRGAQAKCETCKKKQPSFGMPGEKRRWCGPCAKKVEGAV